MDVMDTEINANSKDELTSNEGIGKGTGRFGNNRVKKGGKHGGINRINKVLSKGRVKPEKLEETKKALLELHGLGFNFVKQNLVFLEKNGGDVQAAVKALEERQVKRSARLERNAVKRAEREEEKANPTAKQLRKEKKKAEREKRKAKRVRQREDKKDKGQKRAKRFKNDPENEKNRHFRDVAKTAFNDLDPESKWPDNYKKLFIDGNNMFYVTEGLRKLTLNKKTSITEKVIASVSEEFAKLIEIDTEVVFDNTRFSESKQLDNGSLFSVTSARPDFPTTDAKLIQWAQTHPEEAKNTVVISSDRALAGQLHLLGVALIRPLRWVSFVVKTITGESTLNSKQWLDAWTEKYLNEKE